MGTRDAWCDLAVITLLFPCTLLRSKSHTARCWFQVRLRGSTLVCVAERPQRTCCDPVSVTRGGYGVGYRLPGSPCPRRKLKLHFGHINHKYVFLAFSFNLRIVFCRSFPLTCCQTRETFVCARWVLSYVDEPRPAQGCKILPGCRQSLRGLSSATHPQSLGASSSGSDEKRLVVVPVAFSERWKQFWVSGGLGTWAFL